MGYYTNYELKTEEKVNIKNFLYSIEDTDVIYIFSQDIQALHANLESGVEEASINMSSDESYKWYEHDEEMRKISEENHGIVFSLYGEGEEPGDLWVTYFKDGKAQSECARVVYPKFDETWLK